MDARVTFAVPLTVLVVFICGCSNGGNLAPSAPSAAYDQSRPPHERVTISQFLDLPPYPPYYTPGALTVGPDKALWIADAIDPYLGPDAIVRITTSGKRTKTFYYPTSRQPLFTDIVTGSDGALWISDHYDQQILRMTTSGAFTGFSVYPYYPQAIAAGPDGALWFVEGGDPGPAVGRITTSGHITTFTKGISPHPILRDITLGPDGALWFTEWLANRIGRITTKGVVTEYSKGILRKSRPNSIVLGPDGELWFTEQSGGRIGRITTSGQVTEYSQGISPGEHPQDVAVGPDGALWFTEFKQQSSPSQQAYDSRIGRITTSGQISEYAGLGKYSGPTGIIAGPDGNMWFVETARNRIGRVNL